jgi:DNA-binding LacI/PurR family transcriptional regulator
MKRPTIAEIAARAGVSIGAVSYALNGRPGVSEKTRKHIVDIANEIGWRPSMAAKSLSGRRTALTHRGLPRGGTRARPR